MSCEKEYKFVFLLLGEMILKIEHARGLKTEHLFYMALYSNPDQSATILLHATVQGASGLYEWHGDKWRPKWSCILLI